MAKSPFPEEYELEHDLQLDRSKLPAELCCKDHTSTTLPGQPRVQLGLEDLDRFLEKEISVPQLDKLAPKLWLVSTPRSSHISPLHHQAVRGRTIIVTERPQLHLIWYYDRIFIKPIPRYLLSSAFWHYLATQPDHVRKAAIGFMRSYSYLVYSEIDFALAVEKGLISSNKPTSVGKDKITWDSFARLIASFENFGDEDVSPRYHYGELRLSRLNFYSRIFLGKLTFHHIDAQWGAFLNGAIAPFIVVFAIIAIILNAMQVELAVQNCNKVQSSWAAFANASKWIAVVVLIFIMLVVLFISVLVIFMFLHDLWFARYIMRSKKQDPSSTSWKTKKSGVV